MYLLLFTVTETLNIPFQSCTPNPTQSNTCKSKHLVPCGFSYKVVSTEPEYTKQTVVYRGPDVAEKFLDYLVRESIDIQEKLEIIQPIDMDELDELTFQNETTCCICTKAILSNQIKVRHHNHVLKQDNFIGAAHQKCNHFELLLTSFASYYGYTFMHH